jgi:transposase-like protein
VRLVRTNGGPIPEIAAELGVNDQTLRNWLFVAERRTHATLLPGARFAGTPLRCPAG